jgi:hypothetical protein
MMKTALIRVLLRLYPAPWRRRYGSEFEDLLHSEALGLFTLFDLVWSATLENLHPTIGAGMNSISLNRYSVGVLVKQPTAFLPLLMSVAALSIVLVTLIFFGIHRQADEGTSAHLWQLLMVGQLPMLAFFVFRWWPRAPKQTVVVLAIQTTAFLLSLAPVFFLHL